MRGATFSNDLPHLIQTSQYTGIRELQHDKRPFSLRLHYLAIYRHMRVATAIYCAYGFDVCNLHTSPSVSETLQEGNYSYCSRFSDVESPLFTLFRSPFAGCIDLSYTSCKRQSWGLPLKHTKLFYPKKRFTA